LSYRETVCWNISTVWASLENGADFTEPQVTHSEQRDLHIQLSIMIFLLQMSNLKFQKYYQIFPADNLVRLIAATEALSLKHVNNFLGNILDFLFGSFLSFFFEMLTSIICIFLNDLSREK